jgi:hypothetical protein
MPDLATAHIHYFYAHPITGYVEHDEDGDPILGYYYQIVDDLGEPLMEMMGPYGSSDEAEAACHCDWLRGDYA